MRMDVSWRGNTFLATNPYDGIYDFQNDNDIQDWDYYIDSTGSNFSAGSQNFNNVLVVNSVDETSNIPVTDKNIYGSKNRLLYKWAKGIGMVFQELTMIEYQPAANAGETPYYKGFGIKRTIIDHN